MNDTHTLILPPIVIFVLGWVLFFAVAFVSAALASFLDVCMRPGMIFAGYRNRLSVYILQRRAPEALRVARRQFASSVNSADDLHPVKNDYFRAVQELAGQYAKWEKKAGMCATCFQPWIAMPIFLAGYFVPFLAVQSYFAGWWVVLGWVLFTATGNHFTRKMND